MIFIDSNVPMYLIGAAHPNKVEAQQVLERLVTEREKLVTDVEVLQEILHRYSAIGRLEAVQPAFDALLEIVDEVFPIELLDVQRAKIILLGHGPLSARDSLHLALMERRKIDQIFSFDRGFERYPGIRRIGWASVTSAISRSTSSSRPATVASPSSPRPSTTAPATRS